MTVEHETTEETREHARAAEAPGRVRGFLREHPYMAGLLIASTVAGGVAGALLPIGDLSLLRRCLGGAIAGFYFALFPLGFRLYDS